MTIFRFIFFVTAIAFGLPGTRATVELMQLDIVLSGTAPAGPSPALTVKLEDYALNTVRITMDASNLRDAEFVSRWYFNVRPNIYPSDLSFSLISNPTAMTLANIGKGTDGFKAGGDGLYDLIFDFPPPPGTFAGKFTAGETLIVDVSRPAGLAVADFHHPSAASGANSFHYSAAHVQGIGSGSAWLGADSVDNITPVPEVANSAWIVGFAVFAAIALRRGFARANARLAN